MLVLLAACGGEGGSGGKPSDAGAADAGDASPQQTMDAAFMQTDAGSTQPDAGFVPGQMVDLDGDGVLDGVVVDTNGDGVPDGVDTDGNGTVDEPLPGNGEAPTGSSDASTPFPMTPSGQVMCGDVLCKCSDGLDQDGDKLIDMADPECVSAWDDDESTFATGIPGDNRDDACQDCFFDGNSGSGNDGCYLPSSCLSEGNDSSGRGRCSSCEQTDQCRNFCKAYTPNGCDCFGCCGVQLANGETVNVAIGAGCNIDGNTVEGCTSCVPNDSCINECGRCELCPGKTLADLPADCVAPPTHGTDGGTGDGDGDTSGDGDGDGNPPPPSYTCDDGGTRCGDGLPACGPDYACSFGCCVLVPVILF
jgi:hypothetical protein